MADDDKKPAAKPIKADRPDKVVKKHTRHSLVEHRTFDIKPAGTATPSATSRPVITGNTPQQADPTLTPEKPATAHLTKHTTDLKPVTAGIDPAAAVGPTSPAVTSPAPIAAPATAPAPQAPPTPTPPAPPVATPVQPPIPEVSAPPTHLPPNHAEDELALANLTGVHGIVDKPAPAEVTASTDGASQAATQDTPATQQMHQTPEQARKLAAALNDLSHHPAPAVDDRPVVVVHEHDYLRTAGIFLAFLIGGLVVAVIVIDLAVDAGILNLGIQPLTNFFKY